MPAEEFTHTGNDVADRIKSQFGDTSGAQLSDSAILRWINDGQREIVNSNPILRAVKYTDLIAGQSDYTFPSDKILVIEALYVSGFPITNVSPQEAREFILAGDPEKEISAAIPAIWYERAGVITFYPKPEKTLTNALKLEYISTPVSLVSLASAITIPDRYFNELVTYVLAQALEMDENFDAASYKNRQFREGLDRLSQRDNVSQVDLYPSVMPDYLEF